MAGNQNSGRRPLPAATKALRGNPGQRPVNINEPRPPDDPVIKPAMSQGGSAVWDQLAPLAMQMGTLTRADEMAFKCLCELQFTLDAIGKMKDDGAWADAIRLEKSYAALIRNYYSYFGMEPSSRARLIVRRPVDDAEQGSRWAGVLK